MAKKDDKRSFVMYDSFLEAMKHLNDKDFRECTMRIRDYALEGIEKESESPFVNIILEMAKPNLEAARRRYEACVENGKKGAPYGKDGGAPKGNKNACKNKQPLNLPQEQPLDEDVNTNVNENVKDDVNVDVDEEVNAVSTPNPLSNAKPPIELDNSSGSSITNLIKEIVNNRERLEEMKSQAQIHSSFSNEMSVITADSQGCKSQLQSNPVGNSLNNPAPNRIGVTSSTQRRREIEGGEYSMGDYMRKCIETYVLDLADMRLGKLPQDDMLFWKAVDTYKSLYGLTDDKSAVKAINSLVDEGMRRRR